MGLSNNEETDLPDNEASEGSSVQDLMDDSTEPHHQYPQEITQHKEYMQMLQHHRMIGSLPLVIMEAICQHYYKWEGMSQEGSESSGEHELENGHVCQETKQG